MRRDACKILQLRYYANCTAHTCALVSSHAVSVCRTHDTAYCRWLLLPHHIMCAHTHTHTNSSHSRHLCVLYVRPYTEPANGAQMISYIQRSYPITSIYAAIPQPPRSLAPLTAQYEERTRMCFTCDCDDCVYVISGINYQNILIYE